MEQHSGLANQQETDDPMTIEYFAGLFDGEGCLMVTSHFNKDVKRKAYRALIQFTNTNPRLIAAYVEFLRGKDISYRIYSDDRGDGKKLCYQVSVATLEMMQKWLELMIPVLIGKRAEGELLLDFIRVRLKKNAEQKTIRDVHGRFPKGSRAPFTEDEIQIAEDIRLLRDYTRSHHLVDDIVRADSKKSEKP